MAQGEVKLSFYAGCFEAVGEQEGAHALEEPCTVEKFLESLLEGYPSLRRLKRLIVFARDDVYLEAEDLVSPGDHLHVMAAFA